MTRNEHVSHFKRLFVTPTFKTFLILLNVLQRFPFGLLCFAVSTYVGTATAARLCTFSVSVARVWNPDYSILRRIDNP